MESSAQDDVRRFVLTHISSVPVMEAALLFYEGQDLRRSAGDVAASLYISEEVASAILRALGELGLITEEHGSYIYSPRDGVLADLFSRVALAYRRDLIGMTRLIHDQTQRNATRFAQAFRFRKDT